MNTWRINFNQIRESNGPVFDALERALIKLGVDFYLIGAQSRDVWTNHLTLKDKRTTIDLDYLVYVKDKETWNELVEYLITHEKFQRNQELPYRFERDGIVDLIPFGGMEQDDEVLLENPVTEISVFGCKEVVQNETVAEGHFNIITLVGLCILKLVAFDEKPDLRAKDFEDFLFVVSNYHAIAGDELYSGEYDDLFNDSFELPLASARMLGRQMKSTVQTNARLKAKIENVLLKKLQGFTFMQVDEMYAAEPKDKLIFRLKLMAETFKGIRE